MGVGDHLFISSLPPPFLLFVAGAQCMMWKLNEIGASDGLRTPSLQLVDTHICPIDTVSRRLVNGLDYRLYSSWRFSALLRPISDSQGHEHQSIDSIDL